MIARELLEKISEMYASSDYWESEIASKLDIKVSNVSYILSCLGYYRHKRIKDISIEEAMRDSTLRNMLERLTS